MSKKIALNSADIEALKKKFKKKPKPAVIGTKGNQPSRIELLRSDHPFNEYIIDVSHMSFSAAHSMATALMKRGRCRANLHTFN